MPVKTMYTAKFSPYTMDSLTISRGHFTTLFIILMAIFSLEFPVDASQQYPNLELVDKATSTLTRTSLSSGIVRNDKVNVKLSEPAAVKRYHQTTDAIYLYLLFYQT